MRHISVDKNGKFEFSDIHSFEEGAIVKYVGTKYPRYKGLYGYMINLNSRTICFNVGGGSFMDFTPNMNDLRLVRQPECNVGDRVRFVGFSKADEKLTQNEQLAGLFPDYGLEFKPSKSIGTLGTILRIRTPEHYEVRLDNFANTHNHQKTFDCLKKELEFIID